MKKPARADPDISARDERVRWLQLPGAIRNRIEARETVLRRYDAGEMNFAQAVDQFGGSKASFAKIRAAWKSAGRSRSSLMPARHPGKVNPMLFEAERKRAADLATVMCEAPVDRLARMMAAEGRSEISLDVLRRLIREERRALSIQMPALSRILIDQSAVNLRLEHARTAACAFAIDASTGMILGWALGSTGHTKGLNRQAAANAIDGRADAQALFGPSGHAPRVITVPDFGTLTDMTAEARRLGQAGANVRLARGESAIGSLLLDAIGDHIGDLAFKPRQTGDRTSRLAEDKVALTRAEAAEVVSYWIDEHNSKVLATGGFQPGARKDAFEESLRRAYEISQA